MRIVCLLLTFFSALYGEGHTTISSHPGAYHELHCFAQPSGVIVLEDCSEWIVAVSYRELLANWQTGDVLLLSPYQPWFSRYFEFKFENERTGERVLANWCKLPQKANGFSRTIARCHAYEIVLDDKTRWRLKASDRETTKTWRKGDPIIIGTNDDYFSWSNPNILINMRDSKYVRGACMP